VGIILITADVHWMAAAKTAPVPLASGPFPSKDGWGLPWMIRA